MVGIVTLLASGFLTSNPSQGDCRLITLAFTEKHLLNSYHGKT
jgi:hypothetical protein